MKITVDVTKSDISQGVSGACNACPIAIAAMRQLPGYKVSVTLYRFEATKKGSILVASLPTVARKFVEDFDKSSKARHTINPIKFELDLVEVR